MTTESKVTEIFCTAYVSAKNLRLRWQKNALPSATDAPKRRRTEDYANALNHFMHRKAPHEYGSPEDILAHSLYNRESLIILPEEDLIIPVISFILNCPDIIWEQNKFPNSFLLKRSILFPISEVMGKEFAQIATGLFRYYGSLNVFEILRSSYSIEDNKLVRTLKFTRH